MFRENWRSLAFWRWWWRAHVPTDAKLMAGALVVLALLVGGYFASGRLTGASAANESSVILQTTVTKIVTVKTHGRRTIVRRIPVRVIRTVARASTAHDTSTAYGTVVETRVISKPGAAHVVTQKIVRTVPVKVVRTVPGRGKTVSNNVTSIVTNQRTVTQPVTNVATRTVTSPPETVTHTQTQTRTETQTQTVTQTETVVQTVTQPPETVTVTTTAPLITLP